MKLRHITYQTGYHSAEAVLKSPASETQTLQFTMPALSGMAKAYVTYGTVKEDLTLTDMAAGGQPWLIGDTWVFLSADASEGDAASGFTKMPNAEVLIDASVTPAIGEKAYIIPMSTTTKGGMVTNDDSTAGLYRVGYFKSLKYTNPTGKPAGSYAIIEFDGSLNDIVPAP